MGRWRHVAVAVALAATSAGSEPRAGMQLGKVLSERGQGSLVGG